MGLLKEFKEFAMRGNVVDMAVGVVMGTAFGKIVATLTDKVIMPPLGYVIGGVNFSDLKHDLPPMTIKVPDPTKSGEFVDKVLGPASIQYGLFVQTVFDFVVIAFCMFMLIKIMNRFMAKKEVAPAAPPEPPADIKLLTEIRDLLKNR